MSKQIKLYRLKYFGLTVHLRVKLQCGLEVWRDLYENFRPITLLSISDKIVEKYVSKQIHNFYKNSFVESHIGLESTILLQQQNSTFLLLSALLKM